MSNEYLQNITNILMKTGKNKSELISILEDTNWSNFAEKYFESPRTDRKQDDDSNKLKLDIWQRKVVDKVQKIWYNRRDVQTKKKILIVAPRGYGKSVVSSVLIGIINIIDTNTVAIFSPSEEQSETLISKTKYFIEGSKYKDRILKRGKSIAGMQKIFTGSLSIGYTNRSFVRGYSNNEKTIRGGHYDCVVIDEYARMTNYMVKAGIMPMVRSTKGPIIAITTPFGKYGPAWEAYENRDHLGEPGKGEWVVIKVKKEDTVNWDQEAYNKELSSYSNDMDLARQELEAEFISDDNSVFKDSWFENLYKDNYNNNLKYNSQYEYTMAVDYGWYSDKCVIIIGHKETSINDNYVSNDGNIIRKEETYVKIDVIKIIKDANPIQLEAHILDYIKQYNVRLIVPDGTSAGTSEVRRLAHSIKQQRLKCRIFVSAQNTKGKRNDKLGISATGTGVYSKLNIVSNAKSFYNRGMVRLPLHTMKKGQESYELEIETKAYSFEKNEIGNVKFGKSVNKHPDDIITTVMYLLLVYDLKKMNSGGGGLISGSYNKPHGKYSTIGVSSSRMVNRGRRSHDYETVFEGIAKKEKRRFGR